MRRPVSADGALTLPGTRSARNKVAEEAGVEPTEDAWRPPTGLKPARTTGPDTLPSHDPLGAGQSGEHLPATQDDARGAVLWR
jgi:hypothetical protein